MRQRADEAIRSAAPQHLVLDMSAVSFMDSSGLGLIMGRYTLVKDLGGEFILSEPNDNIRRICSLVGLERIVKIENCSEDKKHESKKKA